MKWMQSNPLGLGLAGLGALLVLVSLAITWAWNRPPTAAPGAVAAVSTDLGQVSLEGAGLGPLNQYQEVNSRPVFNESRRPVLSDPAGEEVEMVESVVTDAPEVRLTGVVITPDQRIVTLTPENEGEAIIALEGMLLEGEYAGWSVDRIEPRRVSLASSDGKSLNIELMVHDQMIEEPPEPEPPEPQAEESGEDSGEPLSRAEEIRQRIQERREQLRREAEDEQADEDAAKAEQTQSYQEAIRAMMNRNRNNDNESKEDEGE